MSLNIRQLEAFRAMMQAGTTKGAAELVGLSQPAVSRLIDAFEQAVDIPLFDRARNRLSPTPEAVH
ncbi:LysR family transcriptional regulator [Methylobacterium indicum]|nr:LysR family transcriptional regulator [Methylobacterium indicum]